MSRIDYRSIYTKEELADFEKFASWYFDVAEDEEINWSNEAVRHMCIGFMAAKGYRE